MPLPNDPLVIGWRETVALPRLGLPAIAAKIDTGARTSALHASEVTLREGPEGTVARFTVRHDRLVAPIICEAPVVDRRMIRNTSGAPEERIVIRTPLVLAGRRWKIDISLADREAMALPLILGRTAIRGHKLLVNPGRTNLTAPQTGEP